MLCIEHSLRSCSVVLLCITAFAFCWQCKVIHCYIVNSVLNEDDTRSVILRIVMFKHYAYLLKLLQMS